MATCLDMGNITGNSVTMSGTRASWTICCQNWGCFTQLCLQNRSPLSSIPACPVLGNDCLCSLQTPV